MIKARLYKPLNEDWDSKKEKQTISRLANYIPMLGGMTPSEAFREIKNEYVQVRGPLYRNSNGKIGGTYAWAEDVLRMLFKDRVYYDTDLRTKFRASLEAFEAECCPMESLYGMTPQEITRQYGDLLKNYTAQDLIDEYYPIYLERQNEKWGNGKENYIDTKGHLYDEDNQPITESFAGLQKRIYEAIQIGIRKGLRRI